VTLYVLYFVLRIKERETHLNLLVHDDDDDDDDDDSIYLHMGPEFIS
jgi:hypothetical protein